MAVAPLAAAGLTAVGVGPGAPDLITLRGVAALQQADVIYAPLGDCAERSVALTIAEPHLERTRQQVLTRIFPMRVLEAEMRAAWRAAAAEIAALVAAGQRVAFITLGDPFLYSTFLYLLAELRERHPAVPVASVPGISSVHAAAGRAGIPLALGDAPLTILPATAADAVLEGALSGAGTVVLLKAGRTLPRLRALLEQSGRATEAVYVRRVEQDGEELIRGLANVPPEAADYLSLVIVPARGAAGGAA